MILGTPSLICSALRAMASDLPWFFPARHAPDDIVAAGLAAWNTPTIDAGAGNAFEPSRVAARFLAVLDGVTGRHGGDASKQESIA